MELSPNTPALGEIPEGGCKAIGTYRVTLLSSDRDDRGEARPIPALPVGKLVEDVT